MEALLTSLGAFVAFHVVPAIGPLRRFLVGAMGSVMYTVTYSAVSVGLLVWVGFAYGEAEYVELWPRSEWMIWVPVALMYPACAFLMGSLKNANPLSVGVRADDYDPDRPAIVSITRHPLMWALILWSGAHIVPNGDQASVLMFGLFALYGAAGPRIIDAKKRRQLGFDAWAKLAGPTSSVPFWAALRGRTKVDWENVACAPGLGGLVLYAVLMGAHLFVIGVSPLP